MAFNLDKSTKDNIYYRRVIFTTKHQQLVLMSVSDNIEREIHPDNDQFIKVEEGKAKVIINDTEQYIIEEGDSITIPAGTYHEVINVGITPVKLYTLYSPPHHPPDTLQLHM
jgi:mannose-6-phosphate isomerase-like protein (cupin superfamily)